MTFEEYQKLSQTTADYPDGIEPYMYLSLGIAEETGEAVEKIKKLVRNNNGVADAEFLDLFKKELGDVLWYLSQLATQFEFSLDDVAQTNLDKLKSRMERGVIKSAGDVR